MTSGGFAELWFTPKCIGPTIINIMQIDFHPPVYFWRKSG